MPVLVHAKQHKVERVIDIKPKWGNKVIEILIYRQSDWKGGKRVIEIESEISFWEGGKRVFES